MRRVIGVCVSFTPSNLIKTYQDISKPVQLRLKLPSAALQASFLAVVVSCLQTTAAKGHFFPGLAAGLGLRLAVR